jgi:hypothetical protein
MSSTSESLKEITWQEAVARLARERTLAETCVALLKRHGNSLAVSRGALYYGEAKAEYDGIISGLIVALARKAKPTDLNDIRARLQRGFEKREAFCRTVHALLPAPRPGARGLLDDLIKGAIEPLFDAIKAIWFRHLENDVLVRKTIETQLEATTWADFAAIKEGP